MTISDFTAFCGFDCRECPAYKATRSGNLEEQKLVAARWSKAVNKPMTVEEILCDGCRVKNGRLVAYCADCNIRSCAMNKEYLTCAHCPDMPDCGRVMRGKTRRMLVNLRKKLGI